MKVEAFKNKVWLATPTMHGEEMRYVQQAYDTNWMSTVGENINVVERIAAEKAEMNYAVGLSCCTAALHLAVKHAGEMLYGKSNKTCIGDLAAAAEELNTACKLAWLNILANIPYLQDSKDADRIMKEKRLLLDEIQNRCFALYSKVEADILNSFNN